MELRADLHLHTRERESFIAYDARDLIDRAARCGFQVLSITNHDTVTFSAGLRDYAEERGILLIPGTEATVEGKHVLLYNIDVAPERIRTFADLRQLRQPDWLVAAPHPFFPGSFCLHERLIEEIDLFDAIEFSHFYTARIDFNRPAIRLAKETGLPLLGTSDSHVVRQFGTTCSLIEGSPTIASVLRAIRKGQVRVESRALTLGACGRIVLDMAIADLWDRARATLGSGSRRSRRRIETSESG